MVLAFWYIEGQFAWDVSSAFRPAWNTLLSIVIVFVRVGVPIQSFILN